MPSTLAVKFMTSSNLIGCSKGWSAGFAACRRLATYLADLRNRSVKLGPWDIRPRTDTQVNGGTSIATACAPIASFKVSSYSSGRWLQRAEPSIRSLQPPARSVSDLNQNAIDLVHSDATGIRRGLIEHLQPVGADFAGSGLSRRDRLCKILRLFLA